MRRESCYGVIVLPSTSIVTVVQNAASMSLILVFIWNNLHHVTYVTYSLWVHEQHPSASTGSSSRTVPLRSAADIEHIFIQGPSHSTPPWVPLLLTLLSTIKACHLHKYWESPWTLENLLPWAVATAMVKLVPCTISTRMDLVTQRNRSPAISRSCKTCASTVGVNQVYPLLPLPSPHPPLSPLSQNTNSSRVARSTSLKPPSSPL